MLQTVTGLIGEKEAGNMLVHEHIIVGFVEDGKLSPADYDRDDVCRQVLPYLLELKNAGCSTFFDCAPEYLGRDAELFVRLAHESGLNIVTNTGFYKSPYLPPFVYRAEERELADLWIREARDGIQDSGVFPGFIKIALNDGNAIDSVQQTILRAAIRTSLETGLAIQCHTKGGDIALHANEIMTQAGFDRERFVWVHAQSCDDLSVQQRLADQGMWISIDNLRSGKYDQSIALLSRMVELGIGDRILLSQDTGWYTVGEEHGGTIQPYHPLFTEFLPYAQEKGLDPDWLRACVTRHPYEAMKLRS